MAFPRGGSNEQGFYLVALHAVECSKLQITYAINPTTNWTFCISVTAIGIHPLALTTSSAILFCDGCRFHVLFNLEYKIKVVSQTRYIFKGISRRRDVVSKSLFIQKTQPSLTLPLPHPSTLLYCFIHWKILFFFSVGEHISMD